MLASGNTLRGMQMAGEERSSALVVPPLLRLFDVPQRMSPFSLCFSLQVEFSIERP